MIKPDRDAIHAQLKIITGAIGGAIALARMPNPMPVTRAVVAAELEAGHQAVLEIINLIYS